MVDEWLPLPGGRVGRFRMRKIPTREQAMASSSSSPSSSFSSTSVVTFVEGTALPAPVFGLSPSLLSPSVTFHGAL